MQITLSVYTSIKMFTVYNNGNYVIHVAFQSAQPIKQIDENLVKRGEYGYGNKTTKSQMDWIAIDIGEKFSFDMKKLEEFKDGNVKIKYSRWFWGWTIEKPLQHIQGKGMEFTTDRKLKYCDMGNDEEGKKGNKVPSRSCAPKSGICAIL